MKLGHFLFTVLIGAIATLISFVFLHFFGTQLYANLADYLGLGAFPSSLIDRKITLIICAILGFIGSFWGRKIFQFNLLVSYLVCLTALVIISVFICCSYKKVFEPLIPLSALWLGCLLGWLSTLTGNERKKRKYEQHLQNKTSKNINSSFNDLTPKNEPVPGIVLTCILHNENELAKSTEGDVLLDLYQKFSVIIRDILIKHKAIIGAQTPSSIQAYFGLPEGASQEDCISACNAILELDSELTKITISTESTETPKFVSTLVSGDILCGLFGSKEGEFFGATGPTVSKAKEVTNKSDTTSSKIIVDDEIYCLAHEKFEFRPLYESQENHEVLEEYYELHGRVGDLSESETFAKDTYWKAIIHLRNNANEEALAELVKIPGKEIDHVTEQLIETAKNKKA